MRFQKTLQRYKKYFTYASVRAFFPKIICIYQKKAVPLHRQTFFIYMKRILFILAVTLVAFTACQKKAEQKAETVYSVDQVYEQGQDLLNDTILVQGNCLHLCKHSGKKAFLRNTEEGEFLLAFAANFDAFDAECLNKDLRVLGVLHEMEVEQPKEEEHQHAEGEEACGVCSSVKKYYLEAISYDIVAE